MWLLFLFISPILAKDIKSFYDERNDILKAERRLIPGAFYTLSESEIFANKVLDRIKIEELSYAFQNPSEFLPAIHFFRSKDRIEQSKIYRIMKILPKGAAVHLQDTSPSSFEILYNLTTKDHLYACTDDDGKLRLKFFKKPDYTCRWTSVEQLRHTNNSFDEYLRYQFNLVEGNPELKYTNTNFVWESSANTHGITRDLITYMPNWKEYFYNTFKELYEDNVFYAEIRTSLPECYDLNGTIYGPLEVALVFEEIVDEFKKDFPDFRGAKIIFTGNRHFNKETIDTYRQILYGLQDDFNNIFAGFDFSGPEIRGNSIIRYLPFLLEMKEKGIEFVFSAGKTNWNGASSDQTIIDAVLLESKRIGHGFSAIKHPEVLKMIKEKDIAIEVMPISNQILSLVEDLRNHPANFYIANGIPMVISSDGEYFYESKGLSYDWYMVFMGMTSVAADIRFLKQMALNSMIFSDLDMHSIDLWTIKWQEFVHNVISENF